MMALKYVKKTYKSDKWEKERRLIIVRQKISVRRQATGKTLFLFDDQEEYRNYRYSAYFTNIDLAPAEVWRLYRGRGDAENRIKEIKYDFGFDAFNMKDFWATEAALIFVTLAYNLMSIFRLFVLQEKTQKTLSTLRFRVFAIGAYFQKINGNLVLNIALTKKRRRWFEDLWNYPLKIPLIPNA
ncbi:MAG: transposase [Bacteroidales bacterium]|nr:transposase [Bacteroidales bacterium]